MSSEEKTFNKRLRDLAFKAVRAAVKTLILCAIYFISLVISAPILEMMPDLHQTIQAFFIVYIALVIVGELTSKTVFQYFFSAARALFVIVFLIFSLEGGLLTFHYQHVTLIVNLQLFLMIAILLSLLGLSKSIVQAVNTLSLEAEKPLKTQ